MIAFFRYLKGYVRIKVWGFSPERFMNLCSNKNILLWDIKKEDDVYFMCIILKDFFKLRPIVKKTKTKVAVLERCGLPFFVPKLFARKVFLLGLLAALGFWVISSLFVWEISIEGNFYITEDKIKSFLEEKSIYVGMSKSNLDIETLEKELRRNFDIITWTSAKLEGTKLKIVLKENPVSHNIVKVEDFEDGSDLISDVEGKIVSMIVRSGVPKVSIGQQIHKGDLLIEGKIPIYNEDATVRKYRYSRSDADIYAKYTVNVRETLPFAYIKKEYTGREKKQYYVGTAEKIWDLGKIKITYPYYDTLTTQSKPKLLPDLYLPLIYGSFTYREYLNVEHQYSLKEAEIILNEKYAKILSDLEEKGVQIIEKDVRIDTESGKWILEGVLTVVSKIGIEEETVHE
ncbi:MAG: sporulation protein YqfD [Lachnospiraceae bacterium]|nr:sporulation protein YqfD [Lachnospiraceae bacterium]